jgi:hypothetical protein
MPTGYTAGVADGSITEFDKFIWQLARGMGALVTMRDDPWDAPVPEAFEPSSYNADRLAEVRAERDRLYGLTDAEAQAEAAREYAEYLSARAKAAADHAARRDRYQAMLDRVRAWDGAPEGIKEFGIEQLERGMEFDCREPFTFYREPPTTSGVEWRKAALEKVGKDIEYHAVADAKERARTDSRNAWVAQLRNSLKNAPATSNGEEASRG